MALANRQRALLLSIHRWAGLTVGLALVLLAVTGGVLVLRTHFENSVNAHLVEASTCSRPISLDRLASIAANYRPEKRVKDVLVSMSPGRSVAFQYSDKENIYLDPCDGTVLGLQNEYGGFFGTLDHWHRFRFMEGGRALAGTFNLISGIALAILGVVIWWPRSRSAIRAALTYDRSLPGIARTLSLHRVFGIYGSALLLLMIVTAIPFSFDWGKGLIELVTGSEASAPRPPEFHGDPNAKVSLDRALETTRRTMPDIHWADIDLPKGPGMPIRVEMLETGAPHDEAKSYLFLDPVTGDLLKLAPYSTGVSLGRKVWAYSLALHSGLVGGILYQIALMVACFAVPVQAYSGIWPWLRRKITATARQGIEVKLVARHDETPRITAFEFVHAKDRQLPAFSAGSHIDLYLPSGLVRQYSLCNDPDEKHRYQIAVLKERESRGGSREIHENLQVGDIVNASLPRNHFELAHGAPHSVLIAGGIGITPLLCMAERLANSDASFELHYCARNEEEAAFRERLANPRFAGRVSYYFSDGGTRLDMRSLMATLGQEAHVYTCGPVRLIEAVIKAAAEAGIPDENVHREFFEAKQKNTADDQPFDVRIASTGETITIPKDKTITEVLADHGIDIPMSCSQGICGTCITHVLEGEVDHRDMIFSEEAHARNERMTPCCSRAHGSLLVLDL